METNKRKKRLIDWIIEIILIIIIILLLLRNFACVPEEPTPTGNVDIIEITCNKEDVCDIKNEPKEENTKHLDVKDAKGEIEFDNVKFGYEKDKIIIKGFSANVKPGQKVLVPLYYHLVEKRGKREHHQQANNCSRLFLILHQINAVNQ